MLLSDLFSGGNGLLNNPQMMQALSGALMQAAQPSSQPQSMGNAIMQGMQGYQQQMQMKQLQDLLKQKQAMTPGAQDTASYPFSQSMTVNSPNAKPGQAFNVFPEDKQQRLAMLKEQAMQAYPDNPTMQQVAITQAIHESGLMGTPSKLAQQGNLFGIKAPGTAGTVNMDTEEYGNGTPYRTTAAFGANASPADSFKQHAGLMGNNRYGSVRQAQSPSEAFAALQKAGYATDPQYSQKLKRVYNQFVAPLYM